MKAGIRGQLTREFGARFVIVLGEDVKLKEAGFYSDLVWLPLCLKYFGGEIARGFGQHAAKRATCLKPVTPVGIGPQSAMMSCINLKPKKI